MTSANRIYNEMHGQMNGFNAEMFQFMKDNESSIRYVNEGSSRVVYALADGTALKVAKTQAGIAQNKQEAKNCMDPHYKYEIFPDFYDADKEKWLALNCEMCSKATPKDFARLFRIQLIYMVDVIDFIVRHNLEDFELAKAKQHFTDNGSPVSAYFIQNLIESKTEAFKAIRSLIDFYRRNGLSSMLLGDVESEANWGLAFRNNEQVLVIIDAGFNQDIYNKYYTSTPSSGKPAGS